MRFHAAQPARNFRSVNPDVVGLIAGVGQAGWNELPIDVANVDVQVLRQLGRRIEHVEQCSRSDSCLSCKQFVSWHNDEALNDIACPSI